jgi:hypothetical protein
MTDMNVNNKISRQDTEAVGISRRIAVGTLGILLFVLTVLNLLGSSAIVEMCGWVHPVIFEFDIDYLTIEDNDRLSLSGGNLFFRTRPTAEEVGADSIANYWEGCVQYWGYIDDDRFNMNVYGINEYAPDVERVVDAETRTVTYLYPNYFEDTAEPVQVQIFSNVQLSYSGTLALYLFIPGLVVLLPIITVFLIRRESGMWWVVMLSLVASYVLTSSLLYISFADVSGIDALTDFGTGIFGGVTTGTAIAFMTKGLENFGE